ncbi:MAG: RagB/SusD family nutrient uptake outer membrane protein [Pseudobacter sp.]|uniref:RagB/SusD family nutrient uptake outer membrane protein n=1 Tax=Pseudobacter sp. TaxID=2045420 RepID=UPI003F812999
MKQLNIKFHISILALLLISVTGCKKMLDIGTPVNQVVSDKIFEDSVTVQSALAGMYVQMYGTVHSINPFGVGITVLTGMTADETTHYLAQFAQYYNNELVTTDGRVAAIWTDAYATIYRANDIIDGVTASAKLSATAKKRAIGEAKFLRAYCYFYLTNLFDKVPLVTTTDVSITPSLPRSTSDQIYQQILSDLKDARDMMRDDYALSGGERIRVNKWAASAMLARVHLYLKDWENAEAEASAVINKTSLYGLETLDKVFLANSKEAIWQFTTKVQGRFAAEGVQFLPVITGTRPNYVLRPSLLAAFEQNDNRKTAWTGEMLLAGKTYTYARKFRANSDATANGNQEYGMVLRLAEQYLIRAEARAHLNKITGNESAASDLLMVRDRAGLGLPTANDQDEMLVAVAKERRIELFTEWGHRWLDLKRTGKANEVLLAEKPTKWKSTAVLFPVPAAEITRNPALKPQNQGY